MSRPTRPHGDDPARTAAAAARAANGTVLSALGALSAELRTRTSAAAHAAAPVVEGVVAGVVGLGIRVEGVRCGVGALLTVVTAAGPVPAQVVAVNRDGATCMPLGATTGVAAGDRVVPGGDAVRVPAGFGLLGRVVDPLGRPMDGGPVPTDVELVPIEASAPNPLHRRRIDTALPTGVKVLDTLVAVGAGQRVGIMAGSGVGKSTILGMAVKGTAAPVRVVALVGERGREVREFLEDTLDEAARARTVVVVATGDDPPMLRLTAAFTATRIAEWFRDQGVDVLLVVDSVTRTALAQREVALAAGEPPATRGYPASVFAMLPRLLERTGPGERGSITALYTVLVEGDDLQDPIGDTVRGILDGHVVLSRRLATAGHFPSVDVLESVSRVERAVLSEGRLAVSQTVRKLLALFRDVRELVEVGAYAAGSDPQTDLAIRLRPALEAFCRQSPDDVVPSDAAWAELAATLGVENPDPERAAGRGAARVADRLDGRATSSAMPASGWPGAVTGQAGDRLREDAARDDRARDDRTGRTAQPALALSTGGTPVPAGFRPAAPPQATATLSGGDR
jgi:flagellum-specific ATP synthase